MVGVRAEVPILTSRSKSRADNIGRTLAPDGWRLEAGLDRVAALDRGNDAQPAPDQAAELADHAGLGLRGIVGGDLRADRHRHHPRLTMSAGKPIRT